MFKNWREKLEIRRQAEGHKEKEYNDFFGSIMVASKKWNDISKPVNKRMYDEFMKPKKIRLL